MILLRGSGVNEVNYCNEIKPIWIIAMPELDVIFQLQTCYIVWYLLGGEKSFEPRPFCTS